MLGGTLGEVAAHVVDGWVYGPVSRHSLGNLLFNIGLTGSFACLATAMTPDHCCGFGRHGAWLIVLCLLASYHLKLKWVQYTMQMMSTVWLTSAHAHWSQNPSLSFIFPLAAIAIIDVTFILVKSNCQWLHTLPSFYSWVCYVIPMLVPLEQPELTGGTSGPVGILILVLALCLHRRMKHIPSQLGMTLPP